VVALLLPLILVKGAGLMLGNGPASADASTGGKNGKTTKVMQHPNLPKWSDEQKAAAKYIDDLRGVDFGPSPLLHRVRQTNDNTSKPHIEGPTEPDPPNVTVRATMRASRGNVAIIDRGRYRVGDSISDQGWVVKEIGRRSVILVYPKTGTTKRYDVPLP
jgi:hypothetical protein